MELAAQRSFNLVIDEFQEFYNINESVFSDMHNIWDSYRKRTRMNLIICGSVYSLMQKIFQNSKEPLFGRTDNIIKTDYSTYSGMMLERYFKQKLAESMQFREIGSCWDPKNEQHKIDIVALKLGEDQAFVAEVTRQKKNFKRDSFASKVTYLKHKVLVKYNIETGFLSLEDM